MTKLLARLFLALLVMALIGTDGAGRSYAASAAGYTFTTLDYPGAASTVAAGISGDIVFGGYTDKKGANHGFVYSLSGKKYISIDATAAGNAENQGTFINNVSGNTIIGSYLDSNNLLHGFTCNLQSMEYTVIDNPEAGNQPGDGTTISAIAGDNLFGSYNDPGNHGFIYDAATQKFTDFDEPSAGHNQIEQGTFIDAVTGNIILGHYVDANLVTYGYIYDPENKKFTSFSDPSAGAVQNQVQGTFPSALSGRRIVGYAVDAKGVFHAFVYDLPTQNFTDLDDPAPDVGAAKDLGTYATGITGDSVIGSYTDKNGTEHIFIFDLKIKSYLTLDDPAAGNGDNLGTSANSVTNGVIVGGYTDSNKITHGFVAIKN
jgi:hypothetical protein